jgi:hypothetical protein
LKLENNKQVVGYDAREMWFDLDANWPEARRQRYLYRPTVKKPLSVDTAVWPSIFSVDGKAKWASHFGYQESWSDLFELQSSITKYHEVHPVSPFRIIAIVLFLGEYTRGDSTDWSIRIPYRITPDRIEEDWQFLGYDVADSFMLSVLSNCNLPPDPEGSGLRKKFGAQLNDFHLFDSFDWAVEFKRLSDERFRGSHAPCFVFGLWTIS